MRRERRPPALAIAGEAIAQATPDQLDALCIRMQTVAVAARMAKRPLEERTARRVLAMAERRLAELCAAV